ncbi:ShlB/FhaC/HecB family hemolysin secretion/activation protein [Sphingosinicella rhizophila]|uniref:ShlB/FhaC/HecB family hemolysin secretion/activation protein n=1 Tax=Sphingosinicella rhizophila TaxID=3050082 RepID=A0ABU3Q333_9SPHN|nr:ShlB/FhaC/HecB family hemolysin secretion/activation protein [Sphingosinicella sp. GR2756]MDT9597818.1 ShlB/FhaC/HecB family hemolysin secretion/activation protein [Sphingosinicella sp. GR2756]
MKWTREFIAALAALCLVGLPASIALGQVDEGDASVVIESLDLDDPREDEPATDLVLNLDQKDQADRGNTIVVGAIRIEGATLIPQSLFAPIIEAYMGRSLAPADLRRLASDIANVARGRGYGLATAWIPGQSSGNGLLRVEIDEGRIHSIEARGTAADIVGRMLAPLVNGRPVRTAELERRLLLAGDISGVRLGKARLDRRNGRNVLSIVAGRENVQAEAAADNWGTDAVGPIRARLAVDFNGLVADDDRLTLGGVVTPLQPKEFYLFQAGYSKAIGTNGAMVHLNGYFAESNPGAELSRLELGGRSMEAQIGLSHPFLRTRATSLWGNAFLRVRDSEQDRRDLPLRDDRITALTLGAYGVARWPNGRLRTRLTLIQGLDLFGANEAGDLLASRPDADGTFTKLEYWAEYQHYLGRQFSIQAQIQGQIASGPLLSSEEMGLGGRYFLRGYDYRERSGDQGGAGSIELRYDLANLPEPLSMTQFYAFMDGGTVRNSRRGFGGGSLASLGAGVRGRVAGVDVGLEVGLPLKVRYDPAKRRGPRLSFTLGKYF